MPPNSTNGKSLPMRISPSCRTFCSATLFLPLRQRSFDVATEQAVAITRRRGEFRVELASDKPRMLRHFHHLDQLTVSGTTGNTQAGIGQLLHIGVIHFVTMAMALNDFCLAITLRRNGIVAQVTDLAAEAHGAAQVRAFTALLDTTGRINPFSNQCDHR